MTKTYKPKQFSPNIYAEWGELFGKLTTEDKAEILMGITKYPNYQPKNDVIIWDFINSQLKNQYESFLQKCKTNGESSRNYWSNKDNERLPNDNERYKNETKEISNDILNTNTNYNTKQLTETGIETKTLSHITNNKEREEISKEDMTYLKQYAKKNGANNIDGYVFKIISNGSYKEILENKKRNDALKEKREKEKEEYNKSLQYIPTAEEMELQKELYSSKKIKI